MNEPLACNRPSSLTGCILNNTLQRTHSIQTVFVDWFADLKDKQAMRPVQVRIGRTEKLQ